MNKILPTIFIAVLFLTACNLVCPKDTDCDLALLDAWKDSTDQYSFSIIDSIKNYVHAVTATCGHDSSHFIPKEDRIAVFDMDGTIACERPVSMEMLCGYTMFFNANRKCRQDTNTLTKKDSILIKNQLLSANSDSLIEVFKTNTDTIYNRCIPTKGMQQPRLLSKQFFKPMVQLINYLKCYGFDVYIVSGSSQQFIWAIIENVEELDFERSHLIGSLTNYDTVEYSAGSGSVFRLKNDMYWSNSGRGKAISIYNRIGKMPVFAFGNTIHDFDMFALTSSNNNTFTPKSAPSNHYPYSTMCCLLNHNDSTYEDQYNAYPDTLIRLGWKSWKGNSTEYWSETAFNSIMSDHHWFTVNMSKNFVKESVFIDIE